MTLKKEGGEGTTLASRLPGAKQNFALWKQRGVCFVRERNGDGTREVEIGNGGQRVRGKQEARERETENPVHVVVGSSLGATGGALDELLAEVFSRSTE